MSFDATRDAYDRYMGRYSDQLAVTFLSFVGGEPGHRALDVGCGPGALTQVLATGLGAAHVAAADPSESFVAACADRVPGADVRRAVAAELPWIDATFDLVVSQLVLNFLPDPGAGVAEMLRVVRPGGTIAACTWDYADGMTMLRTFWDAAHEVDPASPDEARTMRLTTERELAQLWATSGLTDVRTRALEVSTEYTDFEDYWQPFMLGIGPGGAYATSLDASTLARLRDGCRRRLGSPDGPFTLTARAVAVSGRRSS
ncbi:class I SAM-dependent methyltransferase [Aeromicrobium ginsengisoli]|uniref:Methyltransferase domain-containing protein n=1 Tax=Aeromicrobium ginsengisoli TaxID=363867 RepID=A0A5M4FE66_9ACTN|nr:methyltransferase domain-containing protein [Aeromicrobium ginsengisoli]KAA1397500.1 methyltransferase domain-containing protein [Aeromicrobium ginsengisoli]